MQGGRILERSRRWREASPGAVDVLFYAASTVCALVVLTTASVPQYREWARFAVLTYAIGTAAAVAILALGGGARTRVFLGVLVFVGAGVAPLGFEVVARAHTSPGLHAQSEVLITEEAATALLDGRDPYASVYLHGSLVDRPLGTKTHFPYLPGMAVFGLPRALDGRSPLADARLFYLAGALAAAGFALRGFPSSRAGLRIAQVLLILPTGALALATGGDDLPVVALVLLAFVMLSRDRPVAAGVAAGAAAALKQSAWVVLPFMLVAAARQRGPTRLAAASATVAGLVVLPFMLWNPPAFVEDVVRFPLGIGREQSAAGTPSIGSALRHAMSGHGDVAVAIVVLLLAALAVWLLRRPSSATVAGASRNAAILFAAALVLAPSVRIGYVIYPANLFALSLLLPRRAGTVVDMSSGAAR